jgi:hypothetical protein
MQMTSLYGTCSSSGQRAELSVDIGIFNLSGIYLNLQAG